MKTDDLDIRVFNHHSRSLSFIQGQLHREGLEYSIFTDKSNWINTGAHTKHIGQHENFIRLLLAPTDKEWIMLLADDMELCTGFSEAFNRVFAFVPEDVKAFNLFHPTNNEHRTALSQGHNIIKAYSNFWMPAFGIHVSLIPGLVKWAAKYVQKGRLSEDGIVTRYFSRKGIYAYTVMPSLAQHVGLLNSLFGNPAKAGPNIRQSFTYRRNAPVKDVDWAAAWATPYVSNAKKLDYTGLNPGA